MPAPIYARPATEVVEDDYERPNVAAPALRGLPLKLFLGFCESPFFGVLASRLRHDLGYAKVLDQTWYPEPPTFEPNTLGWQPEPTDMPVETVSTGMDPVVIVDKAYAGIACDTLKQPSNSGWRPYRITDFNAAYSSQKTTPTQVAEAVIAAVEGGLKQSPKLRYFFYFDPALVREAAAASTARWAAGKPLSVLDGVPFGVKDMEDVEGMPTTAGTSFLGAWHTVKATSPCVRVFLEAGAVLLGKLATHEIGIGTTGLNAVLGSPRNPYSVGHHTGGSSSGPGAAVAAGLCPVALGSDGGGSIRIPSSLCGIVGLKPTFRRLDEAGGVGVDATVAVFGPMTSSVEDAAIAYAVMAAGTPEEAPGGCDSASSMAAARQRPAQVNIPLLKELSLDDAPLRGKTAGVYWKWFEDAEPDVVAACKAALETLQSAGLRVVDIVIPELNQLRMAHGITITSEMLSFMTSAERGKAYQGGGFGNERVRHRGHWSSWCAPLKLWDDVNCPLATRATAIPGTGFLGDKTIRTQLNAETRSTLSFAGQSTGASYVSAQRIRTRGEIHFRRMFQECDVIITPSTRCTAPAIHPASLSGGESDLSTTMSLMAYVVPANFLGFPAISVPVGVDRNDMPIGLQIMAQPWHEATLLVYGAILQRLLSTPLPKPVVWYDVLKAQDT